MSIIDAQIQSIIRTHHKELRERYAGMAMQGALSTDIQGSDYAPDVIAIWAVKYADALIAELDKQKD